MTVTQQLKNKHKRQRRDKKINMVKNGILAIVGIALMMGFVELGLRAWEAEMDIQTQKNIEWQEKYSK